jgi:hypothetical protein
MGCINSITSKSVNTDTQALGHKITNWSRPRGFDSGRSLFAKIQNGDAAALRHSVTLIEEVLVTSRSHFLYYTYSLKTPKIWRQVRRQRPPLTDPRLHLKPWWKLCSARPPSRPVRAATWLSIINPRRTSFPHDDAEAATFRRRRRAAREEVYIHEQPVGLQDIEPTVAPPFQGWNVS